ncbi:hypothetical protein K2X85_12520 [bacterium]|nr:hypothetical protein [bacterium]
MMQTRCIWSLAIVWAGVLAGIFGTQVSHAASHRTRNFVVKAVRADVARQVAEYAEHYRRSKASEWLGQEIPDWADPCHVEVVLKLGDAGGATSFAFDNGRVVGQDMTVEGPLERILNSVLPHEVTHTIFAAKFGRPLPRWADEGGAVLSEDAIELDRHDRLVREVINTGRAIPLSRLFLLTEYPSDVMALYAQGFSLANYLVSLRGKSYFLDFVWDGQLSGWNAALAAYYGIYTTEDLERQWITWLRDGRGTGSDHQLYAWRGPNSAGSRAGQATSTSGLSPAALSFAGNGRGDGRIVRGQMPDEARNGSEPIAIARPVQGGSSAGRLNPFDSSVAAASPASAPKHSWLALPRASRTEGETTVSSSPSLQQDSFRATAQTEEPRRRSLPVAVGRTLRRSAP